MTKTIAIAPVRKTITVNVSQARAFEVYTAGIDRWWPKSHHIGAAPLKRSGEFPPLVYHMIAIGERSGQLEEMLLNLASAYETQVDVRIGALTSLLEPVLIVVMGGVVAFIVFSILMPILQLNTVIH